MTHGLYQRESETLPRCGAVNGKTKQNTFSRMVSAIPGTFLSPEVYRDAALRWPGYGWSYLLLLIAFVSLVMAGGILRSVSSEIRDELPRLLADFPLLELKNGRVVLLEGNPPVFLRMEGRDAAIIDPTGTITSLDEQEAAVLVTATDIRIRMFTGRDLIFDLSDTDDVRLGKADIRAAVEEALGVFPMVMYPVAYVMVYIGASLWWSLQALFYGVVGSLLLSRGQRGGETPPLQATLRLTCLALTPAIIVRAVFTTAGITSIWAELFVMLVEVSYIVQALRTGWGALGISFGGRTDA